MEMLPWMSISHRYIEEMAHCDAPCRHRIRLRMPPAQHFLRELGDRFLFYSKLTSRPDEETELKLFVASGHEHPYQRLDMLRRTTAGLPRWFWQECSA